MKIEEQHFSQILGSGFLKISDWLGLKLAKSNSYNKTLVSLHAVFETEIRNALEFHINSLCAKPLKWSYAFKLTLSSFL